MKKIQGEWEERSESPPLAEKRIEERARALLGRMSLEERLHQMSGDTPIIPGLIEMLIGYNKRPFPAGENHRLCIPGIRFTDGPRGVAMYRSTCFPVAMARGASWDTSLEERVGDAIGIEARAQGANFFGGVCVNVLRHPAWGRAQETYGEDPYHLGEMGSALVRGVQRHIMACVKHFAANSMENKRVSVNVVMDERTLREVYLPHFKRCVDEGAAAVMTAYNRLNGQYCGHNSHLLRDILKGEWGFRGFVMSDFLAGIRGPRAAVAGLDVEMPLTIHFGRRLRKLLRKGEISQDIIDEAVMRILRQKIRFARVGERGRYSKQNVAGPEHRELSREAARKSMVLLKNERLGDGVGPLLPINASTVKRLAVIGRLADIPNTGDRGSSMVRPPYVITPLAGIRRALPGDCEVTFSAGRSITRAVERARQADAAVIVAGNTHRDEGEYLFVKGGDRDVLTLKPHDEKLILETVAANPRTVVVLMCGSAVITETWREKVPAILLAWYPGMEGGNALADILFGGANPSGKLPCAFPRSGDHLPYFDKRAGTIEYGYFHGYRFMDREGYEPAFPFGFGLGYTSFSYGNLRLDREEIGPDEVARASVDITNTGDMAGEEVAQLYVGYEGSTVDRPKKELKGFVRVRVDPGETRRVDFELPARSTAHYETVTGGWITEPVSCTVYAGPSSREKDLLSARLKILG
ncbi:MAG: glycoside hydrolase family 3 C-terminal domain-containing protein [Dehalococcoidia bacterium]|nr:glycoside hydrolase family 3 C-terminal domain-containing protein [Dehalococcoidia bacterium]